jgi:hypothetical protein
VRFPDARRPEDDHILPTLDEAEFIQTFDLLPAHGGLKGEIEVAELFHDGQPAGAHRGLQPPVIAQLNLRRQQLLDRFRGGERPAIDALENRIESPGKESRRVFRLRSARKENDAVFSAAGSRRVVLAVGE